MFISWVCLLFIFDHQIAIDSSGLFILWF